MREQSTNILRYCTAIWKVGYLDSWIFGQLVILYCKKTLFDQSAERATFLYSLCFSRLMRNEQRDLAEKSIWRMNNLYYQYLSHPSGSPKYGTTRKNTQRYYTLKRLIRYIYPDITVISWKVRANLQKQLMRIENKFRGLHGLIYPFKVILILSPESIMSIGRRKEFQS